MLTTSRELVQLYLADDEASFTVPRRSLKGTQPVVLAPGESKELSIEITGEKMHQVNMNGRSVVEPGMFATYLGGISPLMANQRLDLEDPLKISSTVND